MSIVQLICLISISIILISCLIILYKYYRKYKLYYTDKQDILERIEDSNAKHVSENVESKINELCTILKKDDLPELYKKTYILKDILSQDQCDWIIHEAEKYANEHGWQRKRHKNYPAIDNEIKDIPALSFFIENLAYTKIIPAFREYYNLPVEYLGIDETFIVKYSVGGQSFLEPHQDSSDFSFVLTLNKDFKGGGTYFLNTKEHLDAPVGSASLFCGKNLHMGKQITDGIRYIIAGFLSFRSPYYCEHDHETIENFTNPIH